RYGNWRVVPNYGSVWVPSSAPAGWAPYTTGSWTLDPFYGWTWVDTAPWGWAPYHYGRWVFVDGFWAWAPGPVVVRPLYAPALVAFLGVPGATVAVKVGGPPVGWVALGWGEPIVPWWGPVGFVHVPWWGGWGGPRIVNNVVISRTTVVNVQNITVYRNMTVHNAVVAVDPARFGRGPVTTARITNFDVKRFEPTHAAPGIAATPASFAPSASRGIRPPEAQLARPVVATRAPRVEEPTREGGAKPPAAIAAPHLVPAPQRESSLSSPRPPFGQSTHERQPGERPQPPPPPRPAPQAGGRPGAGVAAVPPAMSKTPAPARPDASHQARSEPSHPESPRPEASAPRGESPQAGGRRLPGEPANGLSPHRAQAEPAHGGGAPEHGGGREPGR
ncbi:MAG TPA: DUF6600 domain-containing protein, partial [Candidatus Methylomirabilis sp.]|nr:DUF6600 domain-containing protein [Candidatus Methylomirabilis sp.]